MTSLDALETNVLTQARAFIEPTDGDRDRVFAQLTANLGLCAAVTTSRIATRDQGWAARVRRIAASRKAIAVTFALLGSGAGYGAGYLSFHTKPDVARTPAALVEQPPVQAMPEVPLPLEAQTNRDDAVAGAKAAPRVTAISAQKAERRESETLGTDPLGDELALLGRAERAIRAKNALLALGLLRELDQRYPKGKLLEERRAASVLANCLQLSPEAAQQSASAYLRTAKSNLYHERVRQLCGLEAPAAKQKVLAPSGD